MADATPVTTALALAHLRFAITQRRTFFNYTDTPDAVEVVLAALSAAQTTITEADALATKQDELIRRLAGERDAAEARERGLPDEIELYRIMSGCGSRKVADMAKAVARALLVPQAAPADQKDGAS